MGLTRCMMLMARCVGKYRVFANFMLGFDELRVQSEGHAGGATSVTPPEVRSNVSGERGGFELPLHRFQTFG
jgi:hypothetical protein